MKVSVYNCPDWMTFHVINVKEDHAMYLKVEIRDDVAVV